MPEYEVTLKATHRVAIHARDANEAAEKVAESPLWDVEWEVTNVEALSRDDLDDGDDSGRW